MERTKPKKYRGIEDVYEAAEQLQRPAVSSLPSLRPPLREAHEEAMPPLPPPTTSYHQPTPAKLDTAPTKDFVRVPNSVTRDALPAGLFKGTSKKVYDALYQRTRGAVQPVRVIKVRQGDLMAWAQVSHNTLRAHLRHLEAVGLVVRKWESGDNDGAVYEVFIPEELPPPTTSYHHLLPPPTSGQKLVGPSNQKLLVGGGGQVAEESTTSENPNTFIRQEQRDDDEAFAPLMRAAEEITGKAVWAEQWRELAELLAVELKIAAGRTTVSSPAAFLTAHLRRRLWKKEKRQLDAEEATLSATSPTSKMDTSQCPDCRGTGMWYPEGFDKGVARCRHEKLTNPA